jgi:hypothetical protein
MAITLPLSTDISFSTCNNWAKIRVGLYISMELALCYKIPVSLATPYTMEPYLQTQKIEETPSAQAMIQTIPPTFLLSKR